MVIDNDGDVTIVFQDNAVLPKFLEELKAGHDKLKNDNLIVNLLSMKGITAADLSGFLLLSRKHRAGKQSFIIVTDKVSYDELPEELVVVPTLQEAKDLIEMEEIERDLGL
jgi:hypothetical protein